MGHDSSTIHLARRLTFGSTPQVLDEIAAAGPAAWLDAQLDPASIDDTETDRRLWSLSDLGFDAGRLMPGGTGLLESTGLMPAVDTAAELLASASATLDELEAALAPTDRDRLRSVLSDLRLATVVRCTYSRRQVLELMVDHWWNHLNIWPGKSLLISGMVVATDRDVIRPHALGRFADMLARSAADPAMLLYLDNWTNQAVAPNENYGRELLELHTVGSGAGFAEADVRDAARVFTGWTIDRRNGRFRFEPEWHDGGPKQVLGWSTRGSAGQAGMDEGVSLLAHLARHPATAHHLVGKLVRRLVADDPPADLVSSAAEVYLAGDTAIAPVLRHIVASDAFWSAASGKFRRPFDFFVSTLRSTGADIGDPIGPNRSARYSLDVALTHLGQRPFDAASPAGYPDTAADWLGAGLLPRWAAAHELARGGLGGVAVDLPALTGGATRAGAVVDELLLRLHGSTAADRRQALLDALGLPEDGHIEPDVLPGLVGLALCAEEVHLR